MRRRMLMLVLLTGGLMAMGGCRSFDPDALFKTDRYIVVIDQTDSTKELRSKDAIQQFIRALEKRPNLDVVIYSMMPDRTYPTSRSQVSKQNFGIRKDGTYTGGDLQQVINLFDNKEKDKVLIITDGENNFGNTPTTLPKFSHPKKFYLIGVRDELWQGYNKLGVRAVTLDGVANLTKQLVFEGRLKDHKGGQINARTGN